MFGVMAGSDLVHGPVLLRPMFLPQIFLLTISLPVIFLH